MTDKEKRTVETFAATLSQLSESEKRDLLQFVEGMAFLSGRRIQAADGAQQRTQV